MTHSKPSRLHFRPSVRAVVVACPIIAALAATVAAVAEDRAAFRLCTACASVGGGGEICDTRLCIGATGCSGELLDQDNDGQADGVRAICVY